MSHLTLVYSRDDRDKTVMAGPLPPAWNGSPIEWHMPWKVAPALLRAHNPKRGVCWTKDARGVRCTSYRFGTISGLINKFEQLHLSRCLECGHDVVVELGGWQGSLGEVWDLDETDYLPLGSWAA